MTGLRQMHSTTMSGEKRLLLIQAWSRNEAALRSRFSNLISYSSLTLAAICALIPEGMFEAVDVVDEYSQEVNYDRVQYDLVMISSDTSSILTAYRHSAEFQRRGAYTVIGGYHATALPEEVGMHCDTVISGPAEKAVPAFLRDFCEGHPLAFYREPEVCSAQFPIPDRAKITGRRKLRIPAITANRGCINHCKYCSMPVMWRSDPRPVQAVIDEIRSLHTKLLIFYDPNFFANRDYAVALMQELKKLHILWVGNATADFGHDEELMELAYRSGCRGVLIGLESLNAQSLKGVAKRYSDADKYREIIANLHRHRIAVNGCFVLGFDSDTEEELAALPERVDRLGLDLCRFSILTPYPGTQLYRELDSAGRIRTKEWSLYNQHHVVYEPAQIPAERLHVLDREVWKQTFTWRRIFRRVLHSPTLFRLPGIFLLGANIGFKYLGIDEKRR